jgi:hypothetical protein
MSLMRPPFRQSGGGRAIDERPRRLIVTRTPENQMPESVTLLAFSALALGMALTPGPNMLYLISRSICQGPGAGLVSLGGVALGFIVSMLAAAFGITAVLMAVPFA